VPVPKRGRRSSAQASIAPSTKFADVSPRHREGEEVSVCLDQARKGTPRERRTVAQVEGTVKRPHPNAMSGAFSMIDRGRPDGRACGLGAETEYNDSVS
tara:strand:- start:1399 stop:1695 length:297 start_codon:yes stop_codon:yes gene_type:complete